MTHLEIAKIFSGEPGIESKTKDEDILKIAMNQVNVFKEKLVHDLERNNPLAMASSVNILAEKIRILSSIVDKIK